MEANDETLLEAWRQGDRAAGNALFERHFDALYRFFDGKVRGDVGDLVQRTFLGLVEGRDRFRGDASVRTFLFAIARNELYRFWRARDRDAVLDFSVQSLHDLAPTASQATEGRLRDRILLEALRRLPVDLQVAVELHYWESMSGSELATVLGVPEGTVRSRLRRALELLEGHVRELSDAPATLRETLSDLDRWARRLRDEIGLSEG